VSQGKRDQILATTQLYHQVARLEVENRGRRSPRLEDGAAALLGDFPRGARARRCGVCPRRGATREPRCGLHPQRVFLGLLNFCGGTPMAGSSISRLRRSHRARSRCATPGPAKHRVEHWRITSLLDPEGVTGNLPLITTTPPLLPSRLQPPHLSLTPARPRRAGGGAVRILPALRGRGEADRGHHAAEDLLPRQLRRHPCQVHSHHGGNPEGNRQFLESAPIQMTPESITQQVVQMRQLRCYPRQVGPLELSQAFPANPSGESGRVGSAILTGWY